MKQLFLILFLSGVILTLFTSSTQQEIKPMDSIGGHVYFTRGIGLECTPLEEGTRVENISLRFTNRNNDEVTEVATNALGRFDVMMPENASLQITPSVQNDRLVNRVYNGLSTFDMILIRRHILQIEPLNCPRSKIAADFNYDGRISGLDLVGITPYILGILNDEDYRPPTWRFIPNILVNPTIIHPDPNFSTQFWNTGYANANYPFDAKLKLKGVEYTYNGTHSWMNEVSAWEHTSTTNGCSNQNYDFWLVKAGDVNGSASIDFNTTEDPTATPPPIIEYDVTAPVFRDLENNTIRDFTLKLSVKSELPLVGYQVALAIDPAFVDLINIEPLSGQTIDGDYNTSTEALEAGHLMTTWISEDGRGTDINEWTNIISLAIRVGDDVTDPNFDIEKIIQLDEELLIPEFITDGRLMNHKEIEINIELFSR